MQIKKNPKDNIVEEGQKIFFELEDELKKEFPEGSYVSIDIKSKDYFVGETSIEAVKRAKKKYPRRIFFLTRIGKIFGNI